MNVLFPVTVLGSGSALPERVVTTADICETAFPDRSAEDLETRTGIAARRWCAPERSHAALGVAALRRALADAALEAHALRRVIFVNSTGGDTLVPATVNRLIDALEINGRCDGFDLNNACMGFLSGFDLACRSAATGLSPVAVVVVEQLSRHINAENRRSYAVLADAAAAVIVGAVDAGREAQRGAGVLGTWLGNNGEYRRSVTLAHTPANAPKETIQFQHSNKQITAEALGAVTSSARAALERAGLTLADIDWVLVHQPNGSMFEKIRDALEIPRERTVPIVSELGSVGAASIPVSLDRLRRSGRVKPGDHILMVGVGSGMSYGATIYRVGGGRRAEARP